jgi:hypothetical protein
VVPQVIYVVTGVGVEVCVVVVPQVIYVVTGVGVGVGRWLTEHDAEYNVT